MQSMTFSMPFLRAFVVGRAIQGGFWSQAGPVVTRSMGVFWGVYCEDRERLEGLPAERRSRELHSSDRDRSESLGGGLQEARRYGLSATRASF
jgi:hypothetical protein